MSYEKVDREFFDGRIVVDFLQEANEDDLLYSDPTIFPPGCCATGPYTRELKI